jgi:hypothetical protein
VSITSLVYTLGSCQLLAAAPPNPPQWILISGVAVLATTFMVVAWRLSGRLRQIKHRDTVFEFGEPTESGGP